MKKFYLIIGLLCSFFVFGQNKSISKKVEQLNLKQQSFESFHLFSKNSDISKSTKYLSSATDATVLTINQEELNKVVSEAPSFLSIQVPYQGNMIDLQLYKQSIFTDSFRATDQNGNVINYQPGQYYRGIVKGDYNSIVAISFFDSNVVGVISTTALGNVVLGKSVDKQDYVTYSDKNLTSQNPFRCGADDLEENLLSDAPLYDSSMANKTMTENCVRIYYEIAFRPYQLNNSDEEETLDWLTAIHNNISTLYANDDINISLHAVKIWTSQDPYVNDFTTNLYDFRENTPDFDGDLAHLVTSRPGDKTSVAFLNALCTSADYAFSNVDMNYPDVPTYSWTIHAMTHEMGHSLGSPHTHACLWNGDDTAIDGCYTIEGSCPNPGYPEDAGTIMSYCHLVPTVGIDFNLGFGEQPSELIRTVVDSKPCLGEDCMPLSVEDMTGSKNVTVYPNPTNGVLNIQSTEKINFMKLTEISGKSVINKKATNNKEHLDLSNLPNGVYVLTVETNAGKTTKKIIKK